jgi:hypothetical protein
MYIIQTQCQQSIEVWQTIKSDRKRHMHMLKEALEKEIHG